MRLTRTSADGQHHVTVPKHHSLRTGTLAAILDDVATNLAITREQLLDRLG
jgi:DNA-directed RNA polymerase subunit H (RpoH/RPB5)